MARFIEIDGSMGEGGGQILRYSLALSALLLKPLHIFNIRAKRSNPGLRPQHLTAVQALASITDAEVKGAYVGSKELWFIPRTRRGGSYKFSIGTAGSVTLVIQAILPALLLSSHTSLVEITGGTDVPWSPTIDYVMSVFIENLRRFFDVAVSVELRRRGHYPRGGGCVVLKVAPIKPPLTSINVVKRGKILSVRGRSHCVRLPSHVAVRQARTAANIIKARLGIEPLIDIEYYKRGEDPHLGPGSGITVYAICENSIVGADALGERGKPAEKVGEEAATKLIEELSTCMALDRHMGDMIIPYVSLAEGSSVIGVSKLTMHTVTAINVTKRFLDGRVDYEISGDIGDPAIIRVKGAGLI